MSNSRISDFAIMKPEVRGLQITVNRHKSAVS